MLTGQMHILPIQQDTLVAARIIENSAAELLAVFAAHHKGADRVGAVVDSDCEGLFFHRKR